MLGGLLGTLMFLEERGEGDCRSGEDERGDGMAGL